MKHSEEHWEVVDDEDSNWKRDPGEVGSLEDEALFLGSGFSHWDHSSAMRTFSMVHTLPSWLEVEGLDGEVPGRLRVNSKECSSMELVVPLAVESPHGSLTVVSETSRVSSEFVFRLRVLALESFSAPALVGADFMTTVAVSGDDREIDKSPILWVMTGGDRRGSRYVNVPEFQSLK